MDIARIPEIWRNLADHPLNSGIVHAAMRWTAWQVRARLSKDVTIDWVNDLRLSGRHGMISISMQAYNGLHELRDMCFATHLLREDSRFFDIGANIGVYTILVAGVSGAKVVAFEPIPSAVAYLKKNVAQNALTDWVTVRPAAVSRTEGTVQMSTEADVMNKIVEAGAGGAINVEATTVDAEAAHHGTPTLIKIDVEGFEPDVIAGATGVLNDPALLALILEINDNARQSGTAMIHETLDRAGFEETGYDPQRRLLCPADASRSYDNRLFIRTASQEEIITRLIEGKTVAVRGQQF